MKVLMTETYRIINGITPPIMENFFHITRKYAETQETFKKYLMKIGKQ